MSNLYFTKEHEYVKVEGDTGYCGLSNYAQEELGEVIKVILPEKGKTINKGDEVCYVESPKESAKVYSPVSGEILDINEKLEDEPELINSDPYGEGWIFKIKITNPDDIKALMDEEAYKKYIEG